MGIKLFVGGIPWSFGDKDLADGFKEFGEVSEAKVITDRESGRSRGFGFVSFVNEQEGRKAIETMDGQILGGRNINVNEAKEREPRAPQGGGPRHHSGGPSGPSGGGGGGGRRERGGREDRRRQRDQYGD